MFQKFEATPTGLIFGGVFALTLALFGLRSFNGYVTSVANFMQEEFWLVILGDIIGLLVAAVGVLMLGFGIYYYLSGKERRTEED